MSVYKDKVRPAGRFLEVTTADGWSAVLMPSEIDSIRGRREGGTCIHTRNGREPILVDVPIAIVIAALKGAENAKTA